VLRCVHDLEALSFLGRTVLATHQRGAVVALTEHARTFLSSALCSLLYLCSLLFLLSAVGEAQNVGQRVIRGKASTRQREHGVEDRARKRDIGEKAEQEAEQRQI
jgi:hypothetical protein